MYKMMSNKATLDSDSEWDTQGSDVMSPLSQKKGTSETQLKRLRPTESPSRTKDKRHRLKKQDAGDKLAGGSGSSTQVNSNNLPPHSQSEQKRMGDMFTTTPAKSNARSTNKDEFPPHDFRPALPPEKSRPDVSRSALSERKGRKYKADYSQEIETPKQGSAKDYPWNTKGVTSGEDEKTTAREVSHKSKSADNELANRQLSSDKSPCHETKSSPDMPFAGSSVTVQKNLAHKGECSGVDLLQKFNSQMEGKTVSVPSSDQMLPDGVVEKVPYEMHLASTDTNHPMQVAYTLSESNLHYIQVSHQPTDATMAKIADSVERIAGHVWRELFASLRIITSVFGLFLIELLLFLSRDVFSAILLRSFTILADFLFKPILAVATNAVFVPLAAAVGSIFAAAYSAIGPVRTLVTEICSLLVRVLGAFRLVSVQTGGSGKKMEQRLSEKQLEQQV